MISRLTNIELLLRNKSRDSTEHYGTVTLEEMKIKYQVARAPLLPPHLFITKAKANIFIQNVSAL